MEGRTTGEPRDGGEGGRAPPESRVAGGGRRGSGILERGDVFFFLRPRVGVAAPRSLHDVQRFFLVLRPEGTRRSRRVVLDGKRLPAGDATAPEWAYVADVGGDEEAAPAAEAERPTGPPFQPGARPVGEGRYAIAGEGGHTHLVYVLVRPPEPGEEQRLLGIRREADCIVAVCNPQAPAPPGAGVPPNRRAELPLELLERLGGRRFAPVDPPDFLDHEATELVLIGAAADVAGELGIRSAPVGGAEALAQLRPGRG